MFGLMRKSKCIGMLNSTIDSYELRIEMLMLQREIARKKKPGPLDELNTTLRLIHEDLYAISVHEK